MSYDLYFNRETTVTLDEFSGFFAKLPNCQVNGAQAVYQNEDTGVYFLFDLATADVDEIPKHSVSFNINFVRPHYFGLEAAPVLRSVIDAFQFGIHDPQMHGMGDGPFSEEGFLRGWNAGNLVGYRAVLQSERPPTESLSRPTAELESIWRWNFEKQATQISFGERVFVPRVFWVIADGVLSSAAVWPDGIAELVPAVDLYFVDRETLAPRRFLTRTKDRCLVSRSELESAFGPFESGEHRLPCCLFDHQQPPKEVRAFVERLHRTDRKTNGISMDQVLNQELLKQGRGN